MNNKILLVEDETDLLMIVADTLREEGYEVETATDGVEGLYKFRTSGADMVVADVMMPRMDGFEMARHIRRASPSVPLLFLTAKSTVEDLEEGFDIGADDYIRKPFELREFIIRIKALLKRNSALMHPHVTQFVIGNYTFDVSRQVLTFAANDTPLSNFEARILERLVANIGQTVDASTLMIALWHRDDPSNRNSLHGYIHKLRHALRHDPHIQIINQRGFGYMLTSAHSSS